MENVVEKSAAVVIENWRAREFGRGSGYGSRDKLASNGVPFYYAGFGQIENLPSAFF